MRWLRRLLCRWGLHTVPPGVDLRLSIRWACEACGHVQPGEMAGRRR